MCAKDGETGLAQLSASLPSSESVSAMLQPGLASTSGSEDTPWQRLRDNQAGAKIARRARIKWALERLRTDFDRVNPPNNDASWALLLRSHSRNEFREGNAQEPFRLGKDYRKQLRLRT